MRPGRETKIPKRIQLPLIVPNTLLSFLYTICQSMLINTKSGNDRKG